MYKRRKKVGNKRIGNKQTMTGEDKNNQNVLIRILLNLTPWNRNKALAGRSEGGGREKGCGFLLHQRDIKIADHSARTPG
jgi:hypothetical protein